jgi:hypothetical protein
VYSSARPDVEREVPPASMETVAPLLKQLELLVHEPYCAHSTVPMFV